MRIAQYNILYAIEMCLLIFCLVRAINPTNETCLVTCAVSLTCATWLICTHSFSLIHPSTRILAVVVHIIYTCIPLYSIYTQYLRMYFLYISISALFEEMLQFLQLGFFHVRKWKTERVSHLWRRGRGD